MSESKNFLHAWSKPVVIAMVGLPARGKSYIVTKLVRYLKWTGFHCEVFNVGSYRRKIGLASVDSNFFDSSNPESKRLREDMAMAVQQEMYDWLHVSGSSGRVAIFDATNTSRRRRKVLADRAASEDAFLLFIESICDDKETLERNYNLKLQNDDYRGMDPEVARSDFLRRVAEYEKIYETIEDDEINGEVAYIKLINVGQKVITRLCDGYIPSQIAFYLQNVHIQPRKIFLSLPAETLDPNDDSYSALTSPNAGILSESGMQYAKDLAQYVFDQAEHVLEGRAKEVLLLAGALTIHNSTSAHLRERYTCYNTALLNELRAGDLQAVPRRYIKELFPEEFERRQRDKLRYRYPGVGGESYLDVIERVRPIIVELERQRRSVVVICHLAILRCIYAYFMGTLPEEIPYLEFPKHRIIELSPGPFGCNFATVDPAIEKPTPLKRSSSSTEACDVYEDKAYC